ncbi:MAG: amino acid permease [Candidatus Tyrphobacter sp.]
MSLFRIKPIDRILAEGADTKHGLKRSLGKWQLTAMGVGAIIGTGIFVLTGVASATRAGPSLTLSFVVAGIVSVFAALCYAEVSSKVPISGSAYTYTYAALGEFFAWIIGWGLVLEYALGAATVSVGWSGYFMRIWNQITPWHIPTVWANGPTWGLVGAGQAGYANLPAAGIILLVMLLLAKGTRESGLVNAIIVTFKVCVVLFFIAMGVQHVNPANWHLPAGPLTHAGGYFPFGITGMLGGAAFMFFAYIGFDAVSTTAEEAKDPARDLPFGIIVSLAICTVLYIIVAALLDGMVPFYKLNTPAPVADAMRYVGLIWASLVVSFGAIAGLTTVLLVMMFGQIRIWFSMSRDGLIPPAFTRIHPRFRTPLTSTIFFGICIAIVAAFTPINMLASLTNMGTLSAFTLVAISLWFLRWRYPNIKGKFQLPLGRFGVFFIPLFSAVSALFLIYFLRFGNPDLFGIPIVWFCYAVWLIIGLVFYFSYGARKSNLATGRTTAAARLENVEPS